MAYPISSFSNQKVKILLSIVTLIAMVSNWTIASEKPDTNYMARLLMEAKQAKQLFPDFLRINTELDDATLYEVQKKYVALQVENGETVAGYKGGFVPKASVGAVLFKKGILTESPVLERSDFHILLVEAEVAFRFCKSVTPPLTDVAALLQAVCEVHPAIELPDAASPDFGMLRKNFPHLRKFLIATNVAASHVLLGPARDPNKTNSIMQSKFALRRSITGPKLLLKIRVDNTPYEKN